MSRKSVRSVPRKQSKTPSAKVPLADAVERNHELLADVIAGLSARRGAVKLGASKALRVLSERTPELLYPHFDLLAGLLTQENQILKWNAMLTLANLARVDELGKIDEILDRYLDSIRGPSMITAANAIRGAAVIGAAKPELISRILPAIMRVEDSTYATPECRNIAVGHALEALALLAPLVEDTRAVRLFAARQLGNPRTATSTKARRFLKGRTVAA